MAVDDILEIIKNEPDLSETDLDRNPNDSMKNRRSFGGVSVLNEISDTIIDPNDFFNDMYKSEVDYSSTFSSPLSFRSTPSPTTSSSSQHSDNLSTDQNMLVTQSETSIDMYQLPNSNQYNTQLTQPHTQRPTQKAVNLETPPISPPCDRIMSTTAHAESLPFIHSTAHLPQTIPIVSHVVANAPDSAKPINIIQGRLIPITTVSLSTPQADYNVHNSHGTRTKKVKIQPKPIAIATKPSATIAMKPDVTTKQAVLSGNIAHFSRTRDSQLPSSRNVFTISCKRFHQPDSSNEECSTAHKYESCIDNKTESYARYADDSRFHK